MYILEQVFNFVGMIFNFIGACFFYRAVSQFIEPKENWICRIVGYALGFCVCNMVIFPRDVFNITINIPLFVLMLIIGFRQKLLVKFSIILLFFPIVIALNFLQQDIAGWIWKSLAVRSSLINAALSNTFILVSVFFWYFFLKFTDGRVREMSDSLDAKSWLLLDLICLASLAAVISSVYYTPGESYKIWLCMLACMVTNLAGIRLVFYLAENVRGKLMQKNAKLQQDYYKELEANQLDIRKFRHDMNNHFSVVADLLEAGKVDEAKMYFQELSGQMGAGARTFCTNSIVNAVLNSKYNRAIGQGIDCFFHVEINEVFFIKDLDVCTIFSNTLDNAIEACERVAVEKKRISVKARCTGNGYFSYEIINSKNQDIREVKGRFRSSKKDARLHGIGIENVKEVVERYRGTIDITYDEESFCVVILIAEANTP